MSAFCPFFSFHEKPILRSKTIELPRNLTWEDKPVPPTLHFYGDFSGSPFAFSFWRGYGGTFSSNSCLPSMSNSYKSKREVESNRRECPMSNCFKSPGQGDLWGQNWMISGCGIGRYGWEILRVYLGSKLHIFRKLDLDRMVEEMLRELTGRTDRWIQKKRQSTVRLLGQEQYIQRAWVLVGVVQHLGTGT